MIRFLAAVVLFVGLALPGLAQEGVATAEWNDLTARAEAVLSRGVASPEALSQLRADLVDWRRRFDEAQGVNATRIENLRAQIAALGPVPAEGEIEAPETVQQRAELAARLEELLVPVREAQTAFTRANGLISETDRLIEADRAAQLLSRSPLPLNPVVWPGAIAALGGWFGALGTELYAPFATPTARALWQGRGVEIGALVFIAILLMWRSGIWLGRLRDRLATREADSPPTRVVLLLISVGRLVLPVVGLVILSYLIHLFGADGLRAQAVADALPVFGFTVLAARWLGLQALPKREGAQAFLPVTPERRGSARLQVLTLGLGLALTIAVETIAMTGGDMAAARGLAHVLLLVFAGLAMLRLGQIFLSEGRAAREEEGGDGFWAQVLRLLGRGLILVAFVAPLVAAVGYVNLGLAIFWPSVVSLGLIALIGVVQGLVFDLYATATRRADAGRDALTPTLVGFGLALAALPLFALIWGVRPSTLGEWWSTFLRGFQVGGAQVSPSNFLTFVIVFVLGYMAVRLLKGVLRTNVLPKTKLDTGGTNAILSGTSYVGITIAALAAITAAGIDLSGLAIVAGALSVGIGFGLQTIVQNFVSGIILLIERPIKLGDWINVGGIEGFVRQISVRSTRIETFDRQDVIVPNADLIAGVVTNYTLSNSSGRVVLTVGVAYGTDTRRVQKILEEVAQLHPMVILNPPPTITFDGFGADSLNFTIRVVIRDILFKPIVSSEIYHLIAERFRDEGLEIPFAQRDLWLRNPEALQPKSAEAP
ncbi:DUF3772 domain-containing protein [Jannaschia pohangensis]|uniref:Small-conductance mechanosensitive channel n=1 Tax=Jannaschia pohangensis TaxID=390807 RepID=A0A1I3HH13_9RHOB|nr:DUF3772 domain-containing protein [Jannaschia pohangensis]SFI35045.1 Small-conductance mechanosensitive channel [Jannaschia pohangensis]